MLNIYFIYKYIIFILKYIIYIIFIIYLGFLCGSASKESTAMLETWVWSLGWEDPLEKGKATHSSILAWSIHSMDCIVHGATKSRTRLSDFHSLLYIYLIYYY